MRTTLVIIALLALGPVALPALAPEAQAAGTQRLTVFGDTGTSSSTQANINLAVTEGSTGYLGLGDYEYSDTVQHWMSMFQPLTSRGHWMALGNHDDYSQIVSLMPNGPQWSVDINGARVVSINTEARMDVGSAQYNAVRGALCNAQESVRVVVMHKPWWLQAGALHPYWEFPGDPNAMDAMVRDCKVNLVLAGHEHNYQRAQRNGATYAVVGTGGESLYAVQGSPSGTVASCSCYGHLVLDVGAAGYSAHWETTSGTTKDAWSYAAPTSPSTTPSPSPATLTISSALSATGVTQGGTMGGTVTVTASAATTVNRIVLAARPPGGTVNGGPYLDVGGQGPVTLAAGVPTTIRVSRAVTTSDPVGSWFAFGAVQKADGTWQNEAATHAFTVAAAGTTPTPTTSAPAITFTPRGGNAWWVQVGVSGADASKVVRVEAMPAGGTWHALTHQSWGDWAAGFYVGAAHVDYRATLSDGRVASTLSTSSFQATFSNMRGNAWWVEANVAVTGGTLAGVDASINGGAWVPLSPTSWGSWAKGMSAPAGSQVRFRADAADGSTVVSAPKTW